MTADEATQEHHTWVWKWNAMKPTSHLYIFSTTDPFPSSRQMVRLLSNRLSILKLDFNKDLLIVYGVQ